jgi:hypothetical protein
MHSQSGFSSRYCKGIPNTETTIVSMCINCSASSDFYWSDKGVSEERRKSVETVSSLDLTSTSKSRHDKTKAVFRSNVQNSKSVTSNGCGTCMED